MRGACLCGLLVVASACGDNNLVNNPPVLASFDLATSEDLPVTVSVEPVDADGDTLGLELLDAPAHGMVTVTGLTIVYTPATDYNGADLFSLRVTDGQTDAVAVVDVTVTPRNDAPFGGADSIAAAEDTPRVIPASELLQNDGDVDGDVLSISAVSTAVNGTVALAGTDVTFTPATNFNGNGSFNYTLSDGTITVDIAVVVAIGSANDTPVAVDDTGSTDEDVAIVLSTLLGNDTDADGNTLSISAVTNAVNGSVSRNGNVVTFTPDPDANGTGTFEYTVTDGVAADTGLVTITINPINDGPVAVNDTASTNEDTSVDIVAVANDTDIDGPGLNVAAVGNVVNGSATFLGGTVTFTPAQNFNGTATLEYTVSDGSLSDVGIITVTVNAVNDPPVAVDDTETTAEDTPIDIDVLANDTDIDSGTLTVDSVANPVNGTVILIGDTPRFTPTANFNGTATFQYTVSDGLLTDIGDVTVNVTAVNDPPVAVDDTATVQANGSIDIPIATLLGNDNAGGDGGVLTIEAVLNAQNGTATLSPPNVTFTPNNGFVGTASFDYVVSDDGGTTTDIGTVTIDVTSSAICNDGVIDAPEQCDDGGNATGDGCSATCTIETGFSCAGEPSVCTPICGDGNPVGNEPCDDGNPVETDGCTTKCVLGAFCDSTAIPGGTAYVVDPDTGHCYVSFVGSVTFANAQTACVNSGGYLVTITSTGEQAFVTGIVGSGQSPWIGASEDGNDTDAIFDWVTDEAFVFENFAPLQPDDDASVDGNGECLHILDATGEWNDTNCNITSFVVGQICEYEPVPCGDSVLQTSEGEECDDSNTASGDNCSSTCQLEVGCGDGDVDAGEECDDNNIIDGDTCSFPTCQLTDGCGDGNIDAGEECDDNNIVNADTCSFPTCQLLEGCGDGDLDLGEQCDDNNIVSGDGCDATCQNETPLSLVLYTFTGSVKTPESSASGLTASILDNAAGTAGFAGADPAIISSGWTSGTNFFQFTLTPDSGRRIGPVQLTFDDQASGTGPTNWTASIIVSAVETNIGIGSTHAALAGNTVNIPATSFGPHASPVTIRFVGTGASAAGGTWRLDNVALTGFVP